MRLPHREGRSQRKHRDAADSSEQAEGLAVLASRDASGWLVKSSTLTQSWTNGQIPSQPRDPHRECWEQQAGVGGGIIRPPQEGQTPPRASQGLTPQEWNISPPRLCLKSPFS